jgi:hypothetical protein
MPELSRLHCNFDITTAMAGASDKARFYLEQAVPQLQEFEQKKIFTKVRI